MRSLLVPGVLLLAAVPAYAQMSVTGQVVDHSANAAAVPMSGYVLLGTLSAANWAEVEVQNQDTSEVQVVLDDGAGTAGTITTVMLDPAAATGRQGGDWQSDHFKGRVRVYGPSSGQRVMLRGY